MAYPVRLLLLSSVCPLVFFSALFLLSFISLGLYLLFFFSTVCICCCLLAFNLSHKQRPPTPDTSSVTTNTEVIPPLSSLLSGKLTYDVFLSFRGEDTRKSFTDHLYTALVQKGVHTFLDDQELVRGESIAPNLLKAIEESRYVIVVFSPNYAESAWCLDEVAKVADCMKTMGQKVLPVFYHVDPSEVRSQTGDQFGKAFEKHQKRFRGCPDKVKRWKDALFQVGNLSGWHLQDGYESKVIQEIVEKIFTELNQIISISEGLVGMDSHLNEMLSYLDIGCPDVRIIGIWGMGGIGKTTIAQVVSKRIKSQFEGDCFLEKIREVTEKQGAVHLQQQLLLNLLKSNVHVQTSDMGKDIISHRLRNKRVLLILDDVDQEEQLEAFCDRTWFGPGSRIILTSRDEHLLIAFGVDKVYKVDPLSDAEALQLFSMKAFTKDQVVGEDFLKLSKEFLKYADGHPLAIKILGSSVKCRKVELWLSTLDRLKKNPGNKVMNVLKVSFDGLEDSEKKKFLDIACFFRGEYIDRVIRILEGSSHCTDIDIEVLIEKSMVTLFGKKLGMHDLIRDLGREIVCQECREEPGKRSRLWIPKEIIHVLDQSKATSAVQSISLQCPEKDDVVHSINDSFSNMDELRLLKIWNVKFSGNINYLSNELQYLEWHECPLDSFPSTFQPVKLVELHMHFSRINQLWRGKEGWSMLQHIDLRGSQYLMCTPDFTDVPDLETLVLQDCSSLVEIHPSLGLLKKLVCLNMRNCKSIESLPPFTTLESLQILRLSFCSGLKNVPEIEGNMKTLLELHLDGTSIEELPPSIERFTGLTVLNLTGCSKIDVIPENLNGMKCLEKLLIGGTSVRELSFLLSMKNLRYLSCRGCKCLVSESYKGLASLPKLTELDLSYCNLMDGEFLNDFSSLISLTLLDLSGNCFVRLPESISQLSKLETLDLRNCRQLQLLPNKLPSSLQDVNAQDCISLTDYPNQIKVLNSSKSGVTTVISLNSSALEVSEISKSLICEGKSIKLRLRHHYTDGNQVDHYLPMTNLAYLKEVEMLSWSKFSTICPRDEVPEWFSTVSTRNLISITIPQNLADDNKWKGFGACAVFAVKGHTALSLIKPDPNFFNYSYQVTLETDVVRLKPKVLECNGRNHGSSSHLLMVFNISSLTFPPCGLNQSTVVRAIFETTNPSMVVQKCGLRLVYDQDAGWYSRIFRGDGSIYLNKLGNTSVRESRESAWLNQSAKWEKFIPPLEEESTFVLRENLDSVLRRYLEALNKVNNSYAIYIYSLKGSPGWFKSFAPITRSNSTMVSIELPQNLHKSKKWMGFAIYASLVEEVGQTMKTADYGVSVKLTSGNIFYSIVIRELMHVRPLSEEHHQLLVSYIPRAQNQTLTTAMDFHINILDSPHVKVQRCGFRIVYQEDIQGLAETLVRCMQREGSLELHNKSIVGEWLKLMRFKDVHLETRRKEQDSRTPGEKYFELHSRKYRNWDWSDPRAVYCHFEGAEIFESKWFMPFTNQGSSAEIQLPLNMFDDDNWLGIAVCSRLSHNQYPKISFGNTAPDPEDVMVTYSLDSDVAWDGLFDIMIRADIENKPCEYYTTHFVYIPRKNISKVWRKSKLARVTVWLSDPCLTVHSCGLRLLFKEDVEHLVETLTLAELP